MINAKELKELTEALRLLNLDEHPYHVRRHPANPDLYGATVTAAAYADGVLVITIEQSESRSEIRIERFEEFHFFPGGTIEVFAEDGDERAVLELEVPRMSNSFIAELAAANVNLNRPGHDLPEGEFKGS